MDYRELEPMLLGRWDEILAMYGIEVPRMKGRNSINVPCPCCADGTDRAHWRVTDGRLSLYCRHCAAEKMKSPEDVIMSVCNIGFSELVRDLSNFAGQADDYAVKKAQKRVQAQIKRQTTLSHKQVEPSVAEDYLSQCALVARHDILNRWGLQHPDDVFDLGGDLVLPIENEQGVIVNCATISSKGGALNVWFLAGGESEHCWHKIKKCDVRDNNDIAYSTSLALGLHYHWRTGAEVRVMFNAFNLRHGIVRGSVPIGSTVIGSKQCLTTINDKIYRDEFNPVCMSARGEIIKCDFLD